MADAQEHAAVDGGDIPTVDPEALTAAREAVLSGVEDSLEEAAETLEGSDDHLESVVTQSRLHAARAQLLGDRAELELEGEELAREAAEHAGRARELASRARELDRDDVGALVATGNARRLAGQRVRDVRRPLRRAVAEEPDDIDAELALSLVLAEEGRTRQARQRLAELLQRAEAEEPRDPRPRLQLALLELEREEEDAAREHLEKVLTIAPDHEVAKAALEDLDERSAVVAQDDPMPREEDAPESAEPVSYEGFLERANEMAERGRCGEASPLFRRALEVRSTGVEALTGLGYCHLDAQEFASAQARFKQALSASPGYQPALYGVAEGYQQQGLGDRAVAAYERYLEKHPKGTRAEMARRQLARLGAREDSSPDAEAEAQQGEDSGAADAEEAEGAKSETDGEKAGDGSGEEGGDGAGEESGGQGEESGEEGEESGEEGESEDEEPSPFLSE